MALINIEKLRSADDRTKSDTLDLLFEPSPAIHEVLLPVIQEAEYISYAELIDACHVRLLLSTANATSQDMDPTVLSILGSHPRLGQKKVESAQSVAEQANLQGEGEELAKLNQEYEEKFPGLRYVVFVNGRGRPEIMGNMRERIDRGDYAKEVDAALGVC